MAVCLKSSLMLACLAVFHLPVTLAPARFSVNVTETKINTICSQAKTTPPGFCLKFLKSNPSTAKLDLPGLARFTIDKARQDASGTLNQIQSLVKRARNPSAKEVYNSCSENYDDAIGAFQDALKALAARDPGSVNIQVSAAFDQADTCRQDLKRISPPPVLMNKIVDLENICDIALVISNMLPK